MLEEEAEYFQEEVRDQEYDEEEDASQQAANIGEGLNMRRQREVD